MSKQIFRKKVPHNILFRLLEDICLKTDKYYVFDINSYKKMCFHDYQSKFLTFLKNYYHQSKQFYLERKLTYNSFTNIIRQICKNNDIILTSHIKYIESKYFIDYYIYHIHVENSQIDTASQTDKTHEIFILEDQSGIILNCIPRDI